MKQAKETVDQAPIPPVIEEQRCIVCSTPSDVGIRIWNQFICHRCEGEMVVTDVTDDKYPFFIKQMKKIWLKENA